MKKLILTLFFIFALCALCSCSKGAGETYFVHSICFESKNDNIKMTAVLEKQSKENNDYFTTTSTASSLKKASEKIMSEYRDCYFATCDLYFISLDTNSDTILKIAKEICDSNIFPTTGDILGVYSTSIKDFADNIKKAGTIRKIKDNSAENSTNIVSFLSKYAAGKPVSVDAYSLTDKKITNPGKATFSKDRKAVLHEIKKR